MRGLVKCGDPAMQLPFRITQLPAALAIALLIDSVTLHAGPRPEATELFKDWIMGCDNERNCSAIALQELAASDDDQVDLLETVIEQPLAHHRDPQVTVRLPFRMDSPERLTLMIDGERIALPAPGNQRFTFEGRAAWALIGKMRTGNSMTLRSASGAVLARASLAGLTAALRRIDGQQGKDETERALVRRGSPTPYNDLPGYSVSLTRPGRSDRPPSTPDAKAMADFRANDHCDAGRSAPTRVVRLDSHSSMMIMPWRCGNGAYNLYSNIMIVNDFGEISPAVFDYDNGLAADGPSNVLVNVSWQEDARVLESFIRHSGAGDCGRIDRYVWAGEKFMLSEQLAMPECRMAFDRIRTWKVNVVDR